MTLIVFLTGELYIYVEGLFCFFIPFSLIPAKSSVLLITGLSDETE